MSLVKLYDKDELAEYICPVALNLACDKVAEVREDAYHLVCQFIYLHHIYVALQGVSQDLRDDV